MPNQNTAEFSLIELLQEFLEEKDIPKNPIKIINRDIQKISDKLLKYYDAIVEVTINNHGEILTTRIRVNALIFKKAKNGNINELKKILIQAKKKLKINSFIEIKSESWKYKLIEIIKTEEKTNKTQPPIIKEITMKKNKEFEILTLF